MKRGGSSGNNSASALVTSSANTFSSMRSQALNRKAPPGLSTRAPRVGGRAIGKEHHAELAADQIEGGILERQRLRIGLPPAGCGHPALPRGGIIEHRLVEVGHDVTGIGRKFRRQRPRHHAAAGRRLQHGFGRKCGGPVAPYPARSSRRSGEPYSGHSFPESSPQKPCRLLTWPVLCVTLRSLAVQQKKKTHWEAECAPAICRASYTPRS